jgi:DNA-binding response OmpR family regulator
VIELDRERFTARVDGRLVELTWKEFELLRVLIEAQGRVVRREVLMGQVWGYNIGVESRTLDVHVRRLRKKLGDEGQRILTLRGVGYRLDTSPELVQVRQ